MKFQSTLFIFLLSFKLLSAETNYQVPNIDPALTEYGRFKVNVKCLQFLDGLIIKYSYPKELTGVEVELTMHQSRFDKNFYFGKNGEMKCDSKTCSVHYINLPYNEELVKKSIGNISSSKDEFDSRLKVARANSGDPGGSFEESPVEYCENKQGTTILSKD